MDERPQAHASQRFMGRFSHPILDDLLLGIERDHTAEPQPVDGQAHLLILVEDKEVLFFHIVGGGLQNRRQGDQSHDLRAGNPEIQPRGLFLDRFEQDMHGRHLIIGQVHRHLGQVILIHIPAHALDGLQRPGAPSPRPASRRLSAIRCAWLLVPRMLTL